MDSFTRKSVTEYMECGKKQEHLTIIKDLTLVIYVGPLLVTSFPVQKEQNHHDLGSWSSSLQGQFWVVLSLSCNIQSSKDHSHRHLTLSRLSGLDMKPYFCWRKCLQLTVETISQHFVNWIKITLKLLLKTSTLIDDFNSCSSYTFFVVLLILEEVVVFWSGIKQWVMA